MHFQVEKHWVLKQLVLSCSSIYQVYQKRLKMGLLGCAVLLMNIVMVVFFLLRHAEWAYLLLHKG